MRKSLHGLAKACGFGLALVGIAGNCMAQEGALDPSQLPYFDKANDAAKASIKNYAAAKGPKALATTSNGQVYWWGPVANQPEANRRALENCELSYKTPCSLAAIDDAIQKLDPVAKPVSAFASLGNDLDPGKVPFLSDAFRQSLALALEKARNSASQFMALALNPRNSWFLKSDPAYTSQAEADKAALAACVSFTPPNRFWLPSSCFLFAQGMKISANFPANVAFAGVAMAPAAQAPAQDMVYANETKDWGIAPTTRLQGPPFGTPTPTSIPGAKVIKTVDLKRLLDSTSQVVVIDVLDNKARATVAGAQWMPNAGDSRFFSSEKGKFAAAMEKHTGGDKNRPVVFLCQGPECWESYNACLHALEAGYKDVYWYRGGRLAWLAAGLKSARPEQSAW